MVTSYRFLLGALSLYMVWCTFSTQLDPPLLKWSTLILTTSHIYICINLPKKRIGEASPLILAIQKLQSQNPKFASATNPESTLIGCLNLHVC